MLTITSQISVDEMLLDWGIAEAETRCHEYLSPDTLSRVRADEPLTQTDRATLIGVIRQIRQPLLDFGIDPPTTWHTATLTIDDLKEIRLIRYFSVPRLADLASADNSYTRRNFTLSKVRGRPIFVGPTQLGPWNLLEGTHRCCGLIAAGRLGEMQGSVDVIVGVRASIVQWHFWR
jgi:hypothetical protein